MVFLSWNTKSMALRAGPYMSLSQVADWWGVPITVNLPASPAISSPSALWIGTGRMRGRKACGNQSIGLFLDSGILNSGRLLSVGGWHITGQSGRIYTLLQMSEGLWPALVTLKWSMVWKHWFHSNGNNFFQYLHCTIFFFISGRLNATKFCIYFPSSSWWKHIKNPNEPISISVLDELWITSLSVNRNKFQWQVGGIDWLHQDSLCAT